MSADAYSVPAHCADQCAVRFLLSADASPGLLPRLLEPFARRDLVPDAVTARTSGPAMDVEITVHAMPGDMVPYVEGSLRQIVGLRALSRLSEAPRALAA